MSVNSICDKWASRPIRDAESESEFEKFVYTLQEYNSLLVNERYSMQAGE